MFQFRRFPTYAYLIQHMLLRLLLVGFPIRISPDLSLFAAPRSFSQLITSFIGSWCQGIPLALFFAWPLNLLCSSFTSSCRSIHFWFLFKFYKNYAGSHFFVSLLAKLLFTLNLFPYCCLFLSFLIHSLFSFQGASLSYQKLEAHWNPLLETSINLQMKVESQGGLRSGIPSKLNNGTSWHQMTPDLRMLCNALHITWSP